MRLEVHANTYVRTYVICGLLMALASTPPHTGTMPCRNGRESTVNGWRQRQISGTSRMESKMASAPASAPASVWLRPRLRSRHRPRLRAGHRARFRPRLRSSTRFNVCKRNLQASAAGPRVLDPNHRDLSLQSLWLQPLSA